MNRLFYLVNITISAAILALTSCSVNKGTGTENGSMVFEQVSVDTICQLFKNIEKPACHLTVDVEIPAASTSEVLSKNFQKLIISHSVNEELQQASDGDMRKMTEAYVHDYIINYLKEGKNALENYDEDMRGAEEWMSYEERVTGKAVYNAHDIVCYQIQIYSYTGGAHGNSVIHNSAFDCIQCYDIRLGDFINESAFADVSAMMTKSLCDQFEGKSIETLINEGVLFQPFTLGPTENFFFTEEGVTWTFDPYEIAPYSTGTISIPLTWEQLYPYIIEDSPVMRIASKS